MSVTVPLFEDGVPERITPKDFARYHLQQFPKIFVGENINALRASIDDVYTMFSGIGTIWQRQTECLWFEKTQACYRLLTAWYLADMYPKLVVGIPTMGGIPLKSKKIGGVDIVFADSATSSIDGNFRDRLGMLKSNPFGAKAYLMITSSIAVQRVRGVR